MISTKSWHYKLQYFFWCSSLNHLRIHILKRDLELVPRYIASLDTYLKMIREKKVHISNCFWVMSMNTFKLANHSRHYKAQDTELPKNMKIGRNNIQEKRLKRAWDEWQPWILDFRNFRWSVKGKHSTSK